MSSNQRAAGYWVSAWWPVAFGIAVIAMESTPYFGADRTSGPLRSLFQMLFGAVSDDRWSIVHHLVRKTGHFAGYGLLGLAWLRAFWMTMAKSGFLLDTALALLGTALIASADEFHQTFLPNRTGTPWDVLLDCCGALVLQSSVLLAIRVFKPQLLIERSERASRSLRSESAANTRTP